MATIEDLTLKNIGSSILNSVSDVLANSDFISRTIGMANSYEDIMFIVQALGREPVSLLGKDYAFIFDHVRRNYMQGKDISSTDFEFCNKFTFYKEVPTVRFADPYNDPMNLLNRWKPDMKFETTSVHNDGGGTSIHYTESNDGYTNNKNIGTKSDLDSGNPGTYTNTIYGYGPNIITCDMIGKTNSNFNHGKYQTLIARFHTNTEESKSSSDPTQTANSPTFGQSHGRNLLKITPTNENGYDNPYCRVWTYHHQYNQIKRQIRPFGEANSQEKLEEAETVGEYGTVGFRTIPSKTFNIEGGSKRLDRHGVLNYQNGTVNIAPTAKIQDYFEGKQDDYDKNIISTKKCMFSIENLAWRDTKTRRDEYDAYGLSPEQKGPLGGRIMWFPPYNLKFGEQVSVNWNPNKFIGRGEDVFTYTNTERRGNLSFTLLIDHPSILDYWTRQDASGKPLAEGNSGGIDNKYNEENTLLRFFAGCEVLSAKPQIYRRKNIKPEVTPEPPKPVDPVPPPPDVHKTTSGKIYAILYYPNNYSGKDDDPEFAVNYLMYGVGTQKKIENGTAVDFTPLIDAEGAVGYEVRDGGISIVNWSDISGSTKYGVNGISEAVEGKAELIAEVSYNGENISLSKQIGSLASKGVDKQGANSEWKYRRWYYRVDKSTENQRLTAKANNYLDQVSRRFNSIHYDWPVENIAEFKVDDDCELVSFADLYCAVNEDANSENLGGNEYTITKLRKMLKEEDGYKITKLTFRGHNSSHGRNKSAKVNASRNNDLATHRALTFQGWLTKVGFQKANEAIVGKPIISGQNKDKTFKNDVDDEYIKAWRSASVVIEYQKEDTTDASIAESVKFRTDELDNSIIPEVERVEIKNKESSNNNMMSPMEWLLHTNEGHSILSQHPELLSMNPTIQDIERVTGKNLTNSNNWETYDNSYQKLDDYKQGVVKRYDNEGEFFKALSTEDPFLHHLISEKIKFFDPAFHSISPEGFNARLTFLHQCTRQGSTVGNADSSIGTTAYNLAFGRPPVCVLRLGDFYYTKIIINSIDIQYEDAQWDMNPEGIGMMPMFANVNMQFTFLGGSDLGGPIARLQNAVSFNYYANASVYDNRAEKVEYDPSGNGKEIAFKGYNYPNMYVGDRLTNNRTYDEGKMDGIELDELY